MTNQLFTDRTAPADLDSDPFGGTWRLYHGDARDRLAELAGDHTGQVRLLVLDPPPTEPDSDFAELVTRCLELATPLLRDDALVLSYTQPDTSRALRQVLDAVLGQQSLRGELIVPARPRPPRQSARSPIATEGQVLLLHTARPSTVLRRPGKWDTLIIPGRPSSKLPVTPLPAAEQEPGDKRPPWSRERILRAVRNYRAYEGSYGHQMSFDTYFERLRADSGAGAEPEFLRMEEGEILRYLPPDHHDVTPNDWLDLPSEQARTDHPEERELGPVARVLDWFTEPQDLLLDPFAGTGASLAAAASCHRNSIGIESDRHWYDVAKARLEQL